MPSLQSSGVIQTNKENGETISISINTIGLKLMFEVVSIKYFIVSRLWTIQLNTCKMFWKISHHETFCWLFYTYTVLALKHCCYHHPNLMHIYMHMCIYAYVRQCSIKFLFLKKVFWDSRRGSRDSRRAWRSRGCCWGWGRGLGNHWKGTVGASHNDKSDGASSRCWCSTKQALHLLYALPWGPGSVWNHLGLS